ncbi:MAG: UDP-N-acetylmuramoyl-L-alanine--D-glutamate ligase [Pseudomonadota bacterium]
MIDLSSLKTEFGHRPVAVFGLGLSGMATVKALRAAGVTVHIWDDDPEKRDAATKLGAEAVDLTSDMQPDTACLVLAPGVPLTHPAPHPVVNTARGLNIEILSDIELLGRATPNIKKIGITGTNGKSTTTALIGHILNETGFENAIGGNLGPPALGLDMLSEDGVYVLEISSFQLDICPDFSPDIAVLLNITPDHLDRHGDLDGYIACKKRILRGQGTAIISIDDPHCREIAQNLKNRDVTTIANEGKANIYTKDKILHDKTSTIDLSDLLTLKGTHNHQNCMAAYAACRQLGLSVDSITRGLHSFPGLPHRQHITRQLDNITFINDSKATNDEAASKALGTYQNIYWIAGGKAKGKAYPECDKYIDRICHAFLIGEAAKDMADWLNHQNVPHMDCQIMHNAIYEAYEKASQDIKDGLIEHAVILLSPACSSFDQFISFEQRGQVFAECVDHLPAYLPPVKEATSS